MAQAHPIQVVSRGPSLFLQRTLQWSPPTATAGPHGRPVQLPPGVGDALRCHAERERSRFGQRADFLENNPHLRVFEENYGLDLGDPSFGRAAPTWRGPAFAPYVASVRARRLAIQVALGREELRPELIRAARAVMRAPELHLLGNHLLENGFGLLCAAAVSSGKEAAAWQLCGEALLRWLIPTQFPGDGHHDEGSTTYHLALVAAWLEVLALRRGAGLDDPPAWISTLDRALAAARAVQMPDGAYPLFNDADPQASPTLNDLFDLASALGFASLPAPALGAAVLGWGWVSFRLPRTALMLKAGADGSAVQPGHVHADLLSFELWHGGVKRIADPGVLSYTAGPTRQWCRSSAAHNGPHLEGEDSSEVWGAFRTGRRNRAVVERLIDRGDTLVVEASRPVWPRSRVLRRIELGPQLCTVEDRLERGHGELRGLRSEITATDLRVETHRPSADRVVHRVELEP